MLKFFVLNLMLIGCTVPINAMYDPRRSIEDNENIIRSCVADAEEKYPLVVEYVESGPTYSTLRTSCTSYSNTTTCSSTGGYNGPSVSAFDANKERAKAEFQSCMVRNDMVPTSVNLCGGAKKGDLCYEILVNGGFQRQDGPHSGRWYQDSLGVPYKRIYLGIEGVYDGPIGSVPMEWKIKRK